MDEKSPRLFIYALAAFIGVLPAFFLVFNAIFSDVVDPAERFGTFILVFVAYVLLGAVFGLFAPLPSWQLGAWLAAPAVAIVLWYSSREPGLWALHLGYLIVAAGSAIIGAYAGNRLRSRTR